MPGGRLYNVTVKARAENFTGVVRNTLILGHQSPAITTLNRHGEAARILEAEDARCLLGRGNHMRPTIFACK